MSFLPGQQFRKAKPYIERRSPGQMQYDNAQEPVVNLEFATISATAVFIISTIVCIVYSVKLSNYNAQHKNEPKVQKALGKFGGISSGSGSGRLRPLDGGQMRYWRNSFAIASAVSGTGVLLFGVLAHRANKKFDALHLTRPS